MALINSTDYRAAGWVDPFAGMNAYTANTDYDLVDGVNVGSSGYTSDGSVTANARYFTVNTEFNTGINFDSVRTTPATSRNVSFKIKLSAYPSTTQTLFQAGSNIFCKITSSGGFIMPYAFVGEQTETTDKIPLNVWTSIGLDVIWGAVQSVTVWSCDESTNTLITYDPSNIQHWGVGYVAIPTDDLILYDIGSIEFFNLISSNFYYTKEVSYTSVSKNGKWDAYAGTIVTGPSSTYTTGDLVTHAGAVWQSETDGNLIEPSDTAAEWSFQGPEAYGARTGDLFKHYLPRAKAWLLTYAKNLTNYLRGIHNTIADALIDEIDRTYYDQFAPTTRHGTRWDGAEGLLPVTGERSRLAARFRARGGQSPKYIQETLQGAGFSVYVHEWWDPYTGDTRDPRVVLAAFTGNIYEQQMGRTTAQFGPTTTQFGQIASAQGYPIVNQPTNNTYGIPSDPNTHPYFLYFCDAIYPQPARIPAARRAEFERLLLTICPAHLWLGVIANFDDAPTEFILLETDDSLLLETGGMLGLEN